MNTKLVSVKNKKIISLSSIVLMIGLGLFLYGSIPEQGIGINLVDTSSIQYGNTMLTGLLIKDSPVGQDGTYLLTTDTGLAIILSNVSGIDSLVGEKVVVNGYVNPPAESTRPPVMDVTTIILEN